MSSSGFARAHDHRACMAGTLATAEALTRARGQKLTPLRRRVLEIVLESHAPMGAYDVLGTLARGGAKPAPPTVYRALDFLCAQGLVHRIDSLSAFAACFAPERTHRGHFLLCRACGTGGRDRRRGAGRRDRGRGAPGGAGHHARNRRNHRGLRGMRFRPCGWVVIGSRPSRGRVSS